jgi:hypothetical protein
MTPDEMLAIYRRHRAAEDARDFSAVMETLAADCFLEQVSLGLRSARSGTTVQQSGRAAQSPTRPAVSSSVAAFSPVSE